MAKQAFAADALKDFVKRIIELEDQKNGLSDDITLVYQEAKGNGFDTKVLRRVVKLAQTDRSIVMEMDAIEDLYRKAIGLPDLKG